MSDTWFTPFKVGLVVLAAILATLYMVTVLTRGESWSGYEGYTVHAKFEDVTGLARNSRIKMSGISVGRLESMDLEGDRVTVTMTIESDVELHKGVEQSDGYYKNGATVRKTQSSMIGDYYLEITPGTEGPVLEDGDYIQNVPETIGPSQLFSKFDRIATDIETITESLSTVFGGREGKETMEQILADLREMLGTMRSFVETNSEKINRILANAEGISGDVRRLTDEGSDSLNQILADAESVVQEVKFIIGESSTEVQAGLGTLRGTLGRLQSTLDSLNYSLQNIQDITDKVNEGEGAVGQLVNDPAIADRTERILEDVENLTNRFDRLKTFINVRSEYHVRHGRFKNIVGLRLQPSEKKYYRAQLVDGFRGTREVVRRDVDTTRADVRDGSYRETTVTTTNEFKFSFELARRLPVTEGVTLTGRFGLIESSGGVGGDVTLLKDESLQVSTDVFQFGVDRFPRLRSFATYEFLEYAYIAGGVDDVLNRDRRDYFIGAGIEFNDEDLKALLTATGVPTSQ